MPKVKLPTKENFITYHNLGKSYKLMKKLLTEFNFTTFSDYIKNMKGDFSYIS